MLIFCNCKTTPRRGEERRGEERRGEERRGGSGKAMPHG
jgi:hypothetical protein